jgi:hypothetical protein
MRRYSRATESKDRVRIASGQPIQLRLPERLRILEVKFHRGGQLPHGPVRDELLAPEKLRRARRPRGDDGDFERESLEQDEREPPRGATGGREPSLGPAGLPCARRVAPCNAGGQRSTTRSTGACTTTANGRRESRAARCPRRRPRPTSETRDDDVGTAAGTNEPGRGGRPGGSQAAAGRDSAGQRHSRRACCLAPFAHGLDGEDLGRRANQDETPGEVERDSDAPLSASES